MVSISHLKFSSRRGTDRSLGQSNRNGKLAIPSTPAPPLMPGGEADLGKSSEWCMPLPDEGAMGVCKKTVPTQH